MSATNTARYLPFPRLLRERGPRWTRVTDEVRVGAEPTRVDDVIEVWADREHDPNDNGSTLRGMWRHIVVVGLLVYKNVAWPFERGTLSRLVADGTLWLADHPRRETRPDGSRTEALAAHDVTLLLAIPAINQELRDELNELELELPESDTGYHEVHGSPLRLVIIDLGMVAEHEDDDLLRWFAGLPLRTLAARRWVDQHRGEEPGIMSPSVTRDLEEYEEYARKVMSGFSPRERLAGLSPQQVLEGLSAEQRLAGLSEPEQVLALPAVMLRGLSEEYVAALPDEVRAKVRARRGG